jgi:hypothetical protein
MMQKPIVFQYWDKDPPPQVVSWMQTWKQVKPEFELCVYNDESAAELIAQHIGSDAAAAYRSCAPPAMRADLFRYCALFAYGGVYVDACSIYTGRLGNLYRKCGRGLLLHRVSGETAQLLINGFLIVKEREDPLMRNVISQALENIRTRRSQSVWDVTGAGILRRTYRAQANDMFGGFEFRGLHSPEIKSVFRFIRGPHKDSPTDWRRMRDGPISIFIDDQPGTNVRSQSGNGDQNAEFEDTSALGDPRNAEDA